MEPKRLYKNQYDKKLSGVCSGLAKYFNVDATLIRLIWVLVTLLTASFPGILAYIIFACVMENEPDGYQYQGNGTYNAYQQQNTTYYTPPDPNAQPQQEHNPQNPNQV